LRQPAWAAAARAQRGEFGPEHAGPFVVAALRPEPGRAVGRAVVLVEAVRKLVDD
jgi:hypothetical protein